MAKGKKVKIINLSAFAGVNFSVRPGQVIEVDSKTAKERIAAGLAKPAPKGAELGSIEAATLPGHETAAAPKARRGSRK